jgi:putative endopeptidase
MLRPIIASLAVCVLTATTASSLSDADRYLDQFIDRTVSPRDDFFHYAVGKWLREHPIPKSERSWGVADVIQEETYQRLLGISKAAASANVAAGSNQQKIGDFWYAAMDTVTIAGQGFAWLDSEFARIAAVTDLPSLATEVARLQYMGVGALYGNYIVQDEKNTELARASRKLEDLRDPIKNYNAMSLDSIGKLTPSIRWREHLADGKVTGVDTVVVGQPEFFQQVERSLHAHSIDDWKTYLRWQLANAYASEAGGRFDAEHFHFFGTVLNGQLEQRPRWKRMLDEEEAYLGDALGALYVKQYFSPRTKQRYEKLTDEIFAGFGDRIRNLTWMSQPTKDRALMKLGAVTKKVGYPTKWKDYSSYAVDRRSFLGNAVRGNIWRSEYTIAKLHRPVDRTEWDMTPQTYNAYYNASNNEIVLPAAVFILPGIADSLADDAIVYAYAGGTTIGHEITHGFDDEGRQFDEKGNLQTWWTPADEQEFNQRAQRIIQQYNGYVAIGTLHVNGAATQGENIADLGGINLGWDAFRKTDQYKRGVKIGGLTPAQRYFIGWSLGWMNEIRPENLAVRVKTDVHAPSPFRVIGPVSNMVPFYEAYGVKPGDRMYRADSVRVQIW